VGKLGRVYEDVMLIESERTLLKVGEDSFAVTLPKAWIVYKGLKHGDVVKVIVNENDDVVIRAKPSEEMVEAKS